MKKFTIVKTLIVFGLTFLFSCNSEDLKAPEKPNETTVNLNFKRDTQLKETFGKALAKALAQSQDLRLFIKTEALKQVTKDYDVVYQVVKDQDISGNQRKGTNILTIRDILLPFFTNEAELTQIENALPLLTIFVPDLQEGSFSALNWDISTQIPFVGIRSYESDDVKIIKSTGEQFILEAKYMPDFPIVVVKDNERVISNLSNAQYNSLNTEILTDPSNPIQLRLTSNNFMQLINPPTNIPAGPRVTQIQADAYNTFGNYNPGGWQRDFIYYGLTPSYTQGGYNQNFIEQLTSFKMSGSAYQAYYRIATSQDPNTYISTTFNHTENNSTCWTDGNFEFNVINAYGAKNSNLGAEEKKGFSVNPTDLFQTEYIHLYIFKNSGFQIHVKVPIIIYCKTIDLLNGAYYGQNVNCVGWDLNNFSNQWKISIEESDTSTDITSSVTETNKYNANFSIEPTTGILKKIGLKFGASYEQSLNNTYTSKRTDVSDDLGSSVISFWDNFVILDPATNTLKPRTYSSGKVEFEFRPMQVQ
jgi:hypothetical protein